MEIISVRNATLKFKNQTALNNVSISFEEGKAYGIVGRNGSGKTVLLKAICGFMPLTSGEIYVKGKRIGKDIDIPKDVGIIIEAPGFLPNYSGFGNLALLAGIRSKIDKAAIINALETVGLDPYSKKHVSKYSLGMRQRLGIAQAIMEDPEILLLDEPFNGLDKSGVESMRILLKKLINSGKTMLFTSHNQADIDELCSSVCEMDGGVLKILR